MNIPDTRQKEISGLAVESLKIWLLSEALLTTESKREKPDGTLVVLLKNCASAVLCVSNVLTTKDITEVRTELVMASMVLRDFKDRLLSSENYCVRYLAVICSDCENQFKNWLIHISVN